MNICKLRNGINAHIASPVSVVKYTSIEDLDFDPKRGHHFVAIHVEEVNRPVMNALTYARLLGGRAVAVYIPLSALSRDGIEEQWKLHNIDIPLMILDSPNNSLIEPLIKFVEEILQRYKKSVVTILLPMITGLKWWQLFLHNRTERSIERAFQSKVGVVTIRVPFLLGARPHNELQSQEKRI